MDTVWTVEHWGSNPDNGADDCDSGADFAADRRATLRERAAQAGMAFGVDGYSDAMGSAS